MPKEVNIALRIVTYVCCILFFLPATAHAYGDEIYSVAWVAIGACQILLMLKMLSFKELEGRRAIACALYLLGVGLLWLLVLYGFQAEPKFHPELESQFRQEGFGKGEPLSNQYRFFEQLVGSQYAGYILIMFVIGLPLLSPLLIAWVIYRFVPLFRPPVRQSADSPDKTSGGGRGQLRCAAWWLLPLLLLLSAWPATARADLGPARSDPFDGRRDRMPCMVGSESHTAMFLHLEIRWQLIVWTTNAGVPLDQTDALGHRTTVVRDGTTNQILATLDPLNHITTIAYNIVGQPLSAQGPISSEPPTTFTYHTNGNLITTTDPLGNSTQRVYDAVSRLLSLTDPRGLVTQFRYDGLNRVTEIADARQGLTRFTYDPNGNLLTVTDAKNQTTAYTYDTMDRLKTRTDALNRQERYQYDAVGNLIQFTDRKNQPATFIYDALNRRTTATYQGDTPPTTTSFVYDAVGRLIHAADTAPGAGAIDFRYDSLDRLIQEITGQGAVAYQYDALGRRTSMSANGLAPVGYQYDAVSRLTQVTQGPLAVGLGYDQANRRTSLTYPNGTSTSYAYDIASRLIDITHNGPSGLIEALTYTYDAAGNRISLTRANGTASLVPQAVASASYDPANEQIAFAGAALTYDQNGNLTNDGTSTYTWDARNRLATITGSVNAIFIYDPLERRVSKTIGGVTPQFLYDRNDVVAEIQSRSMVATYLRSLNIDELFGILRQDGVYFSIYDGLGSTFALTNHVGTSAVQYSYEPFGKTQSSNPVFINPFQFTGQENEAGVLYFYRQRHYSPNLHRFISEDPLGLLAGATVYSYVVNNPISFTDPLGLDVTISLYPGAGPFGHIGAGVNTSQTVGLYPAPTANPIATAMGLNVDGFVHPDLRKPVPGQTITLQTTPQQDAAMLAVINQALATPPQYNLQTFNCAFFVEDILRAGGIQVPSTRFPRGLMNYLQRTYRNGGGPQAFSRIPFREVSPGSLTGGGLLQ